MRERRTHGAAASTPTMAASSEIGEESAGLPLGVAEGYEYESFSTRLEPGDVLTIFTDGFSEAMNASASSTAWSGLKNELSCPAVSVADFGQHILEDVSKFVDGFDQSDDMCLVCFGRVEA